MKDDAYLAFDTSCYTTSVAAVTEDAVVFDERVPLEVPEGAAGLRQSEALFRHIRNLKTILSGFPRFNIRAVAYSEKPRPAEGSYMPVFCAGETAALACAAAAGADAYALTHQHGHLYSAYFGNEVEDGEHIAFHVSGGTLDILKINVEDMVITQIAPLGGKLDITCGQLIDRVGVAAGLGFPAGARMEALYKKGGPKLPVSVNGLNCNLSGAETRALRLLKEGAEPAFVCGAVVDCSADTIAALIENAAAITGIKRFIFTGGVICNKIIREKIASVCAAGGYGRVLADAELCGDNARGLALAARILAARARA